MRQLPEFDKNEAVKNLFADMKEGRVRLPKRKIVCGECGREVHLEGHTNLSYEVLLDQMNDASDCGLRCSCGAVGRWARKSPKRKR